MNQSQPPTKKLSYSKTSTPEKKLSYSKTSTPSQSSSLSSSSSIMTDKEKRKAMTDVLEEATHTDGIVYKAVATSPESKKTFELPLRAITSNKDKDLDVSKTSVWVLLNLSQCSMKEVEQFEKKYKDDLTYSEKLSIKLLKDAIRGNKQAQTIYWGLMEKISNRPKVLNQLNITSVNTGGNTVMTDLLDQITKNITSPKTTPQEGEVVQTPPNMA